MYFTFLARKEKKKGKTPIFCPIDVCICTNKLTQLTQTWHAPSLDPFQDASKRFQAFNHFGETTTMHHPRPSWNDSMTNYIPGEKKHSKRVLDH